MKQLKFPVAAIATSIFLTACGGGGNAGGNPATGIIDLGDNPPNPAPPTSEMVELNGIAADGYLIGATVCLDLNSNLACDSGEPSATTTAGGAFTIDATQEQIDANTLVLVAAPGTTTDEDTGNAVAGDFVLTAPAGSTFISPITTLVQARIEAGDSLATAAAAVESDLGISDYTADYIAANDDTTHLIAQALTQIQIDAVSEFNAVGNTSILENILDAALDVVDSVFAAAADADATIASIAAANSISEIVTIGDLNGTTITGDILSDMTLTSDRVWILDGVVTVGAGNVTVNNDADVSGIRDAGVTLTIEAGTDIRATSDAALIVTRGSRIEAAGTAAAPITFSSVDDDFDGLGEWGGVVIQGFAPQFGAGGTGACFGSGTTCNVEGEGGTSVAVYGGNDAADNSGTLRYVRIAEGGLVAGPNNELNGLTLQGVGHGTTLEFIQVHNNLDDGIEWFGGTVNAKYVVLTNNDDDSLDYDEGYQGNIQYAIIRMNQEASAPQGSNDPRGIEANSSDEDFVEETNATIANALLIGGTINDGEPGMRLRGALTTAIYNSAVRDFTRSCVRIDNAEVSGTTIDSNVTLRNMIGDCDGGFFHNDNRPVNTDANIIDMAFNLTSALAIAEVEAELDSVVTPTPVDNGSGFVFDSTDYIGAVEPGTSQANAWWSGWIIEGSLGEDEASSQTFPDFVDCSVDDCTQTATISGTIAENYTLTSDLQWIVDGVVRVGAGNITVSSDADVQAIKDAGVTLTVEAGTDVKMQDDGTLLITRGSKIMAEGTRTSPITFSSLDDNFDGLGEWGGIVIQGFAPQFGAGGTGACFGSGTTCNVEGEGGTAVAVYGGNDEADDSGVMRYVRIAEGGLVAGPNNELNGLTLQGVGYGTTLEFIQVHNNLDDGIEWFGGNVDLKYAVLTNNDDDSLDYDEGYQGNIQFAIIQMQQATGTAPQGSNDPRGIEANSSDEDFVEETSAVLANISIVGGDINAGEPGMRLRGALTTSVYNTAIEGFDRSCVRIDDANVSGTTINSNVTLVNVLGDCLSGYYHNSRVADSETNSGANVVTFDSAFAMNEIQAVLNSAPSITAVGNSGFTFEQTDYVGAVAPGTAAADAWWADWTIPGSLDKPINAVDSSPDFVSCSTSTTCEMTGNITEDYTMVAGVDWSMDGVVTVGTGNTTVSSDADVQAIKDAGVTLTIEAGVNVDMSSDGTLIITRGSSLVARGEADEPITFASADAGFDGLGEWGGIVIQGFAPQFGAGGTGACFGSGTTCNVEGEGGTAVAVYGGNDPADNSGLMRYVRIAEGGLIAGPNNELNGLTLQGVGHGTDLQYIQVHNNLDDGIEWFGGTVNLKFAVLTNNDDDSLDFDEGYQGNIQHAIIRMSQTATAPQGSNDPRGIEANSSDEDFVEETNGALANILLIGATINDGEPGMRLRGALTASVYNTAVTGFDRSCVRIDDANVSGSTINSNVTLVNVLGDCTQGYYHNDRTADTETNSGAGTITLDTAFALTDSAAELGSATSITAVDNGSGFTFDNTDYIGAVEPGSDAASTWWSDWIIDGSLD